MLTHKTTIDSMERRLVVISLLRVLRCYGLGLEFYG